jgi:hypothetical protein
MPRSSALLAPVLLLLLAAACSSDEDPGTITEPPPTSTIKTETFAGVLTTNGATTFPFAVTGVGTISAELTSLSPDSTKPVGMSLGTWNGTVCQVVLPNDAAIQGSTVTGESRTAGNFCVRIYDAAGTVTTPQTYGIEVTHQ